MNRPALIIFGSLALLLLLLALLQPVVQPDATASSPLLVLCAASNQAVLEVIRHDYEREFGEEIQVQYGPSQTLLTSLEVARTGDLYLPADESYLDVAREKKLVTDILPLARMQVVVVVAHGNPLKIKAFEDLLRSDVRLVQANPDVAAVGKLTRQALTRQGLWDKLQQRTTAFRPTVADVANDVKVGAADAAIIYDAVAHSYPDLDVVRLPEFDELFASVQVGLAATSGQPRQAMRFARYLAARDRGLKRYSEFGFRPVAGPAWSAEEPRSVEGRP